MSAVVGPAGAVIGQRLGVKVKVGLALAILIGLANIPSIFAPTPEGEVGPPFAILVMATALGLASIVAAIWAWRTGSRLAIRLTAAAVIINAVGGLPGLFADIPLGLKVATAVATLMSIAAVVLMFSRDRRPGDAS
jgi:hypothetical protein